MTVDLKDFEAVTPSRLELESDFYRNLAKRSHRYKLALIRLPKHVPLLLTRCHLQMRAANLSGLIPSEDEPDVVGHFTAADSLAYVVKRSAPLSSSTPSVVMPVEDANIRDVYRASWEAISEVWTVEQRVRLPTIDEERVRSFRELQKTEPPQPERIQRLLNAEKEALLQTRKARATGEEGRKRHKSH